jgi:tetratricopeptide (TPR) repeat protein
VDTNFGILGTTTLLVGGEHVENWGPRRERAVLATLLAQPGRTVPIAALLEWAWPDDGAAPQKPAATFHTYATRIRRSLYKMSAPPRLKSINGGYRLDVDKHQVDYFQFRSLVIDARAHAQQNRPQKTIELVDHALRLWHGDPLADCAGERADAWRTRVVHDEWLPANSLLIDALLNSAQYDVALSRLDDLQPDFPLEVSLATQRLSALHGLARFAEATAYYLSTRQRLISDVDEHAAEHLRSHQESIIANRDRRAASKQPATPPPGIELAPRIAPRQLPHQTLEFLGRHEQLDALDVAAGIQNPTSSGNGERPPRRGLVIVDGMAGAGKTALVVHWANRVRRLFPDGDLFVNLNGFSERDTLSTATVVDDFLVSLGYTLDDKLDNRSRQMLLGRLLTDRRVLVILDNARDTNHVRDLIQLLPNAFVIVTSRQQLSTLRRETSATRVRVNPMDEAESASLLMVRAAIDSGRLSASHASRLALLCGGLPLVINVVAESVASRSAESVAAFIDRLDRRQLVMEIGEAGDGSATAYAFFSWSYLALNEPERRLFRLLALMPGTDFGIDAACACDGRTRSETRRSLSALVGAHLVEQCDAIDRFALHDLLIEFALSRANTDETDETRRATETRIVSFFLASTVTAIEMLYPSNSVAPQLQPAPEVLAVSFEVESQARSWLSEERASLLAAVRLAHERGHHDQAWRLADPVAAYLDRSGHHFDSRSVQELALDSARKAGHRDAEASALAGLGLTNVILGDHRQAHRYLDAALRLVEADDHKQGQSAVLHQIGRLEELEGNTASAIEIYRRCLSITTEINDLQGQAWSHFRIGSALRVLERHEQALVELHRASWLAEQVGDGSAHAGSLAEIGSVQRDLGDHDSAAAHCGRALTIAEAVPDLVITAQICITLAELETARREHANAARYARRAVDLCQKTHNVADEAHALDALGGAQFAGGDVEAATSAWRAAMELYRTAGNTLRVDALRIRIEELTVTTDTDLPSSRRSTTETDPRNTSLRHP